MACGIPVVGSSVGGMRDLIRDGENGYLVQSGDINGLRVCIEKLIDDKTKVIYIESIGNPEFNVPDFEAFGKLAQKYDIPLIVDNTFGAAGYLARPLDGFYHKMDWRTWHKYWRYYR